MRKKVLSLLPVIFLIAFNTSCTLDENGDLVFDVNAGTGTRTPVEGEPDTPCTLEATLAESVPVVNSGDPVILFTDITSGPSSGGEGNNGAYLSIFGFNFGNPASLGTATKVYINDVEVARYMFMKNARAQTMPNVRAIQQISVQIGALGGATAGIDYPIRVSVSGNNSNTDKMFMIQPGDIFYVDNINGVEIGIPGDPANPYRYVQSKTGIKGVLNDFAGPGDFVVMRGTGTPWKDLVGGAGQERFVRFIDIAGNAPDGTPDNGPITIMGYPGEDVLIQCQNDTRCGIHGVDGYASIALANSSDWITISNLRIRGGGPRVKDGPINLQHRSDNWRVVNNELFDWNGNAIENKNIGGTRYQEARAGGITGDGNNVEILGNHIHDINGGTKNHGIYVDGGAQDWEIAYNNIGCSFGGNIIQTFDSGGYGNMTNINVHHNLLHHGTRYGVNFSDGTASGKIYDNVIYNTAAGALRFSTASGTSIHAVHNTVYNSCLLQGLNYLDSSPTNKIPANADAIANDWSGNNINIINNIIFSTSKCTSYFGNTGSLGTMVLDNNLYYGLAPGSTPGQDVNAVEAAPLFKSILLGDFRVVPGSPVIDASAPFAAFAIPTDFLSNARSVGANTDIGATER